MSWDEIAPQVHLLLDGRLDDAAETALLAELHSSPELRQRYLELQAVVTGLREFRTEGAPDGFAERVRASIVASGRGDPAIGLGHESRRAGGRRIFSVLTWMAPMAAAMLLSSAAWVLLGSDPSRGDLRGPAVFEMERREEAKAGLGESGRWIRAGADAALSELEAQTDDLGGRVKHDDGLGETRDQAGDKASAERSAERAKTSVDRGIADGAAPAPDRAALRVEKKAAVAGNPEASRAAGATGDDTLKVGLPVPPTNKLGGLAGSSAPGTQPGAAKQKGEAEGEPDLKDKVSNLAKGGVTVHDRGRVTQEVGGESSEEDRSRGLADGAEARRDDSKDADDLQDAGSRKREWRKDEAEGEAAEDAAAEASRPAGGLLAALVDALSRGTAAPASAPGESAPRPSEVAPYADRSAAVSSGDANPIDDRSVTVFLRASRKRTAVDRGAAPITEPGDLVAAELVDELERASLDVRVAGAFGQPSLIELPDPIRGSVGALVARRRARVFVLGPLASEVPGLIVRLNQDFDVQALVQDAEALGGAADNEAMTAVNERRGAPPSARWTDVSALDDGDAMLWNPGPASMALADTGLRSLLPAADLASDGTDGGTEQPRKGDGPIVDSPASPRSLQSAKDEAPTVLPPEVRSTKEAGADPTGGGSLPGVPVGGARLSSAGGALAESDLFRRVPPSTVGDGARVRVVVIVPEQ